MGKHDRCCVGGCDNDKRYLHLCVKRRHVEGDLIWHRFPKDPKKFEIWRKNIKRGLEFFNPGHETFVCSNHFVDGKPTMNNPHPTLFLQPSDKQRRSPQKRSTHTKLPETSHSCEPSMLSKEVKETSRIANVRIYVEQAIKQMKEFRIIKNELPVLLLPVIDDIVTVCASLVNLLDPLCD